MKKFLGDESDTGDAKRVAIISAPLASSLSWGQGAESGPDAILDASVALEAFDDELLIETIRVGIETTRPLALGGLDYETAAPLISGAVTQALGSGRFPVVLGGEHSVTVPVVAAMLEQYPDLHVLQIDAHLDLRQSFEDNENSHACVMRRLFDMGVPFTQAAIRSFSKEEWEFVRQEKLTPFLQRDFHENHQKLLEQISRIDAPLYITFDVDGLDPAIMPATGTPEPGGLLWEDAVDIMRAAARTEKVVGLDFVEFSPRPGCEHAAFTVAKLLYRTVGFIFSGSIAV